MFLPILRFLTLMLAALGMAMGAAHALEFLPKMQLEPGFYAAVTANLYQYFGPVGSVVQVGAILAAALLAYRLRGRSAFRLTFAGMFALIVSLALWFLLVQPVNIQWLEATAAGTQAMFDAYEALRDRWEYGHLAAATAWFLGTALLVCSAVGRRSDDDLEPA